MIGVNYRYQMDWQVTGLGAASHAGKLAGLKRELLRYVSSEH